MIFFALEQLSELKSIINISANAVNTLTIIIAHEYNCICINV